MDAQWIESYYVRQHDTCCEHLRRYARRASNDDLHMVRVAIKKIRATLLMAHELHGLDAEIHFMPYALAFHQAGPVREASLIRDHLATISSDKHALALRTRAISTLHQSLKRSIPTLLRGIEGELDAKLRDEQRAKMEIIMLNCDIKRREEDNAFIVKEQAYNDQQIARQRDLIEKSKGKVDAITGKAKGKPEGVSAESQRVLDNLLKQKTSIEKEAQKNTLDGTLDRDKIKDQEKNIERALKDQVIQKAAVASQKLVVEKLLAKLATIK